VRTYFFPGMDEPRSAPRDDGKTPKYEDPKRIDDLEIAQSRLYVITRSDGIEVEVPGTLCSRPNRTYLGHTSELYETPWDLEDRWLGNDPQFRRIPSRTQRFRMLEAERRKHEVEILRLAAIENPGKCCERRRWVDGWCERPRNTGTLWCHWHLSLRMPTVDADATVMAERAAKVLRNTSR